MSKITIKKSIFKIGVGSILFQIDPDDSKTIEVSNGFHTPVTSLEFNLDGMTYLTSEMNALLLEDLVLSIKQFDNQTYHDKSGHKEVYVLKQGFMGYKKDAKFFSRSDYLFPVGALPGNIGFKLDIAMKMDLFVDATKSYAASYIDNNVAIIHDPELSVKEGDFIKINGIGMYKVTKKYVSLQSVMNKEYVMVGLG